MKGLSALSIWALLVVEIVAVRGASQVASPATERFTLDVRVADAFGRPIPSLTQDDFIVDIDGRPQPIVSAAALRLADAQPGTNGDVGRAITVLVDDLSFSQRIDAAWRDELIAWVSALPARDRVGVQSTSRRIVGMEPGPDRTVAAARLREALSGPVSPVVRYADSGPAAVSVRDALAPGLVSPTAEAAAIRDRVERTVVAQANGMFEAARRLQTAPGTRVLLIVSNGFAPVGVTDHATALRRALTHGGVAAFAVMPTLTAPAGAVADAEEQAWLQAGLAQVVTGAGGRVARGAALGAALADIATAASDTYRLVVDVSTATTTRPNLSVKVTTRNGTQVVSAASRLVSPRLQADPSLAPSHVLAVLAEGEPAGGLAVDAETIAGRDEAGNPRVLAALTVGGEAKPPVVMTFVVLDELGAEVRGGTLRLGDQVAGAFRTTFPLMLADGRYRLRVAVADVDGRIGVVERTLLARRSNLGDYSADDLHVMWRGEDATWHLAGAVGVPAEARAVAVSAEVTATAGDGPAPVVSLALTEPDGREVASLGLTPTKQATGWRVLGEVGIDTLPPGMYSVAVRVGASRESARAIEAPLWKLGPPGTSGAGSVMARRPNRDEFLAAFRDDVRAAWPRFDPGSSLTMAGARQLLDDFAAEVRRPLPAALARTRSDDQWRGGLDAVAAGRDAFAPLARALAAMSRAAPEEALIALAEARKAAPESSALSLLTGMAHAASGRDALAISAWQSVLGTASGDPDWGPLLADALGRVGDFPAATEALGILAADPASPAGLRLVDALVIQGQFAEARAAALRASQAGRGLSPRAELYVLVFSYADALAGDATPAARKTFLDHAARFVEAGGDFAPVVRAWIDSLSGR